MGNWYWFLVLRFNGCAMGRLFAFGFLALIFLSAICVAPFRDDWAQIPIS
jgi:hypothetical protein